MLLPKILVTIRPHEISEAFDGFIVGRIFKAKALIQGKFGKVSKVTMIGFWVKVLLLGFQGKIEKLPYH